MFTCCYLSSFRAHTRIQLKLQLPGSLNRPSASLGSALPHTHCQYSVASPQMVDSCGVLLHKLKLKTLFYNFLAERGNESDKKGDNPNNVCVTLMARQLQTRDSR